MWLNNTFLSIVIQWDTYCHLVELNSLCIVDNDKSLVGIAWCITNKRQMSHISHNYLKTNYSHINLYCEYVSDVPRELVMILENSPCLPKTASMAREQEHRCLPVVVFHTNLWSHILYTRLFTFNYSCWLISSYYENSPF